MEVDDLITRSSGQQWTPQHRSTPTLQAHRAHQQCLHLHGHSLACRHCTFATTSLRRYTRSPVLCMCLLLRLLLLWLLRAQVHTGLHITTRHGMVHAVGLGAAGRSLSVWHAAADAAATTTTTTTTTTRRRIGRSMTRRCNLLCTTTTTATRRTIVPSCTSIVNRARTCVVALVRCCT